MNGYQVRQDICKFKKVPGSGFHSIKRQVNLLNVNYGLNKRQVKVPYCEFSSAGKIRKTK